MTEVAVAAAGRRRFGLNVWREYLFANPIAALEFRRLLRGRRAVYFVTFHLLLLGLFLVLAFAGVRRLGPLRFSNFSTPAYSYTAAGPVMIPVVPHAVLGTTLFGSVVTMEIYALFLLLPGLAAYAIPRDRELRIFSDIRLTLLSPGQIIAGRLAVALGAALLLLVSVAPFLAAGFMTGGCSLSHIGAALGLLLIIALVYTAIGLLAGSEFRSPVVACLAAYLLSGLVTCIFLIEPRAMVRALLQLSNDLWIFAVVYLPGVPLFIIIARERIAGWHERGRMLRPVLLGLMLLGPLIHFVLETRWFTNPFAASDAIGTCVIIIVTFSCAILLLCGRAPQPEQVRWHFFSALYDALREPWRENPLGMPFFLLASFILYMFAGTGLCLMLGGDDNLVNLFIIGLVVFAGMLAYSGLALLLALLLRTPRFISGATLATWGIAAALFWIYVAVPYSSRETMAWLSPLAVCGHYISRAGLPFTDDFVFNVFFSLALHLTAAWFIWRAYYLLWERHRRTGGYVLADTGHD